MTLVHRVLNPKRVPTLDDYVRRFAGGTGLQKALAMEPMELIELVEASGLRGRGGAGFPTGTKWRTVRSNASTAASSTVVVNAAEGEPGTFKDRAILRCNPYQVLEGALIGAYAVGASRVAVALKGSFAVDIERVRGAIEEMDQLGWTEPIPICVIEGPDEYLFGEETALLEVLDGRQPFPRIAPPFRRGVGEVVGSPEDAESGSGLSAHVHMAGENTGSDSAPALVDNVETLANIPKIVERGAAWYRTEGTEESPGTLVCTVTGRVRTPGVGEVLMGTTLRAAIEEIGGGALPGQTITAVVPGASGALLTAEELDTPLTYEAMRAIGSGLGSGSFWVLDESVDPVAAVAGVSRFLAVESCGQCTPCKQDGLVLADMLKRLAASEASESDMVTLRRRVDTVANGARCNLGIQQQVVVGSLLEKFADVVDAHAARTAPPSAPVLVAELLDVDDNGAVIDEHHAAKQPDWTFDPTWGGETPVERFIDHRARMGSSE
ncbi:MAG: NADH-ubiquinone oxidoreductase-F iron-sulfur binding region domain-containing protein [Aquihabitans sp.]